MKKKKEMKSKKKFTDYVDVPVLQFNLSQSFLNLFVNVFYCNFFVLRRLYKEYKKECLFSFIFYV